MEYAFSILMFALAGVLFLYALLLSTGDTGLIVKYYAAKVDNPKKYAKRLSKIIMLVSTAPLASGLVGLIGKENVLPAFLTLFILFIVTTIIGVKYIS